ncbi:MAG: hypothetical protein JSV39_04485 [Candidatus Aenigmatarchaeota archaeon]|nr:MAG: hypothetical protein JSV39_04485 [Candidatus Aenigmarchaeota archaeon]
MTVFPMLTFDGIVITSFTILSVAQALIIIALLMDKRDEVTLIEILLEMSGKDPAIKEIIEKALEKKGKV